MEERNKKREKIRDEVLNKIIPLKKSGSVLGTGVGKTLIGLKHMEAIYEEGCKFLVAAPKKTIIQNWKNEAFKHGMQWLLSHITFTTYISLPKIDHYDFRAVYLDECHSLKFKHGDWLSIYENHFNGTIVGFTGTYPKYTWGEKGKMCNRFCPKVYEYLPDEAIEDEILNDYRIIIHQMPLSHKKDIEKKRRDGKTWKTSEYSDYLYYCKIIDEALDPNSKMQKRILRMKALQSYKTKAIYTSALLEVIDQKVLVFANTKAQADFLCLHSYHSSNSGSDRNLKLFQDGEINQLSAVDQLSEGVNISGLRVIVILHSFSNNRKAAQKIGRALRLSPEETATVHILCYSNSVDKEWVGNALAGFDKSKITWNDPVPLDTPVTEWVKNITL